MSTIEEQLASALRDAVAALNTQPRFKVPSLDSNSYAIASRADGALAAFAAAQTPSEGLAVPGKVDERLARVVRHTVTRFDQLGFSDPDAPVDGGDCVELVGELLPQLRAALPADAARAGPGEAAERKRLTELLDEVSAVRLTALEICERLGIAVDAGSGNADEAAFEAVRDRFGEDWATGVAQNEIFDGLLDYAQLHLDDALDDEPEGMAP